MWSGVTITCFASSYAVSLLLEASRLFFRAPIRLVIMVGFAAAGLLAHTIFLWMEAIASAQQGAPLSNWRDWCLIAAWLMIAAYLGIVIRRPQSAVGLFLLPVTLGLIGLGVFVYGPEPLPASQAVLRWGMLHGVTLLAGTVAVMLGFVAGVMYLVQSYRLKHKLPARTGPRLPSLEWLQRVNKQALVYSSFFIAVGLASGVMLNVVEGVMPWGSVVVVASGILLAWLVVALLFERLYRPARQGRKVAYLTVASFVLLGLVLCFVLYTRHASATGGQGGIESRGRLEREAAGFLARPWAAAGEQLLRTGLHPARGAR